MLAAGGFGADESVNLPNEFGGDMDPQLFGKCSAALLFSNSALLPTLSSDLSCLYAIIVASIRHFYSACQRSSKAGYYFYRQSFTCLCLHRITEELLTRIWHNLLL